MKTQTSLPTANISRAVRCLKALAHPTRLAILCLLRNGERTVCDLQAQLGCTQSNVSQHLGIMREREILTSRRESNQMYYAVKNEKMFHLLDLVQDVYCNGGQEPDETE
jgi:ArsR family transcriptional regulator